MRRPVLESLFNIVVGLQLYLKDTPRQVFSCEIWKIFKNTSFCKTSPVAASVCSHKIRKSYWFNVFAKHNRYFVLSNNKIPYDN